MSGLEGFFVGLLPTALLAYLVSSEQLNHWAAPVGWIVLTLILLGLAGATERPEVHGPPDHQAVQIAFFYANSSAAGVAYFFGLVIGGVGGLIAGQLAD